MTKMAILGKGSMRNPAQEEELRSSTDPKHTHLGEDLHVEISTFASPAEAHARLALALSEIRAYLIPDSNDQIRQQQMRDIKMIKMSGPGPGPGQPSDNPAEVKHFLGSSRAPVSWCVLGGDSSMCSDTSRGQWPR